MANWCYNTVEFKGDAHVMGQLENLFADMMRQEKEEGEGQLPAFIDERDGYLICINWRDGTLCYNTEWEPNIEVMMEVANRFGVTFSHQYEDAGAGIFGRATYRAGVLTEIGLDDADFDRYGYDEDTGMYSFEGGDYECSFPILQTLLDRKQRDLLKTKRKGE